MRQPLPPAPPLEPLFISLSHARRAMRLLCEAWDAARAEKQDIWQFAVEIGQLRALGLGHTELRRLLCQGLLEHAIENTEVGACGRTFRPLKALVLPEQSCFVLTARGREIVSGSAAETGLGDRTPLIQPTAEHRALPELPRWDSRLRQLWWKDFLIKEFRVPADNQEMVLRALEEEGWPPRIDDPLPSKPDMDPKVRLHETIKALNRHQHHGLLRFRGDGSGNGIHWETTGCREGQLLCDSSRRGS